MIRSFIGRTGISAGMLLYRSPLFYHLQQGDIQDGLSLYRWLEKPFVEWIDTVQNAYHAIMYNPV